MPGSILKEHLSELSLVGQHICRSGIEEGLELDILRDHPADHFYRFGNYLVQVQDAELNDLLPAESQQLLGQGGGPFGGLYYLVHIVAFRVAGGKRRTEKVGETHDRGKDIIEIVCDAAGHMAYSFHLLGMGKLFLDPRVEDVRREDIHYGFDKILPLPDDAGPLF